MGRVPDFNDFDGNYFGIMGAMVGIIDPQSRLLIETTYEAIIDAGIYFIYNIFTYSKFTYNVYFFAGVNPQSLRGTKTGVYIGLSNYAMTEGYPESIQPDLRNNKGLNMLGIMGNFKSLYANRISFAFDFKGPSLITDTACSASLSAFNLAMNDLLLGEFIVNLLFLDNNFETYFCCQDVWTMQSLGELIRL